MTISFYCKNCELDQDTENYYLNGGAFKAKCKKCGGQILRLENPRFDPYYALSRKIRIMRKRYAKDLIQPGQDGFQTFYHKQWEEWEKSKELAERKEIQKKKERDEFYKKFYYGSGYRDAARKAIEAEERMGNAKI